MSEKKKPQMSLRTHGCLTSHRHPEMLRALRRDDSFSPKSSSLRSRALHPVLLSNQRVQALPLSGLRILPPTTFSSDPRVLSLGNSPICCGLGKFRLSMTLINSSQLRVSRGFRVRSSSTVETVSPVRKGEGKKRN